MSEKKELFIVRHAKSSWDLSEISDRDRPLKLRGIRNAYEMARRLKIERRMPAHFLTSPANRALHTASIFLNVFELSYDRLKIDERLYGNGVQEILKLLRSQADEINKLMIFGHNPDFSELARKFSSKAIVELPTCGMVVITFKCSKWEDISQDIVSSELIDFPKKDTYNLLP